MTLALDVGELCVDFGSVRSVDKLSLQVWPGQIAGLIGPNGAGKTTTLNAVSGFVHSTGQLRLAGADLNALRPEQRARAGLARTFQTPRLFDGQTVGENFAVGRDHTRRGRRGVAEIAQLVGLHDRLHVRCDQLSPYERMRTELGRALATGPELLLLDEPAAGLLTVEVTELLGLIREVRQQTGCAVLLIDHNMDLVLEVCERISVLDFGRLIFSGTPAEVRTSQAVIDAYLGEP